MQKVNLREVPNMKLLWPSHHRARCVNLPAQTCDKGYSVLPNRKACPSFSVQRLCWRSTTKTQLLDLVSHGSWALSPSPLAAHEQTSASAHTVDLSSMTRPYCDATSPHGVFPEIPRTWKWPEGTSPQVIWRSPLPHVKSEPLCV